MQGKSFVCSQANNEHVTLFPSGQTVLKATTYHFRSSYDNTLNGAWKRIIVFSKRVPTISSDSSREEVFPREHLSQTDCFRFRPVLKITFALHFRRVRFLFVTDHFCRISRKMNHSLNFFHIERKCLYPQPSGETSNCLQTELASIQLFLSTNPTSVKVTSL